MDVLNSSIRCFSGSRVRTFLADNVTGQRLLAKRLLTLYNGMLLSNSNTT